MLSRVEEAKVVCPHLLRWEGERLILIGSRCKHCGEVYFPAASSCTRCCATDLAPCDLGDRGVLWSWTVQSFMPKAPYNGCEDEAAFQPYGVGYVQMPSGIKVESRLTLADPARLRIGMDMKLVLEPYGTAGDGRSLLSYAFDPV